MYSMTKCGKSGNKAVYNYTNKNFNNSFMQQDKVFISWYDGARWQIYKMKTIDISMLIIIHMQSKRKSYIVRIFFLLLLEIMTFSDLRVGSCFLKNIITSSMFHPECIQWQYVTKVVL